MTTAQLNANTKARADADSARFNATTLSKARADAESARLALAAAGAAVKDLEAQLRASKRETQAARAERDRLVSEAEARADRAEAREVRAVARACLAGSTRTCPVGAAPAGGCRGRPHPRLRLFHQLKRLRLCRPFHPGVSMVNKVLLLGNLGAAPELRSTSGGTPVASMSVATSRRVKKGEEWVDETEWHRVTVWGKDGEFVAKYGTKGQTVHVEGRLQTRKYTDKDGVERYATDVVAEPRGVHLIRKGEAPQGERQEPRGGAKQERRGADPAPDPGGYDDSEIPF